MDHNYGSSVGNVKHVYSMYKDDKIVDNYSYYVEKEKAKHYRQGNNN